MWRLIQVGALASGAQWRPRSEWSDGRQSLELSRFSPLPRRGLLLIGGLGFHERVGLTGGLGRTAGAERVDVPESNTLLMPRISLSAAVRDRITGANVLIPSNGFPLGQQLDTVKARLVRLVCTL